MTYRQKLQARAKKNNDVKALKKLAPHQIIIAPIMTEKTYSDIEKDRKYTFKVVHDANKNDVKQAIRYLYNVDAKKVNILNAKYKRRQQRGLVKKAYKKAIVTLNEKDKIDLGL